MRIAFSLGWMVCLILCAIGRAAAQSTAQEEDLTAEEHAAKILLPKIELQNASLLEAVELLRVKCRDRDPAKRGANLLVINPADAKKTRLSLSLANVSAKDTLLQVATSAGWKVRFDPRVVVLTNAAAPVAHNFEPDKSSPMMQRAAAIIRPQAQFQGASVEEAVEFIRIYHLSVYWVEPGKRFVNIVTRIPEKTGISECISMDLKGVSQFEALTYIAEMAGVSLRADEHALVLVEAAPAGAMNAREEVALPAQASGLPVASKVIERASGITLPKVELAGATVQECVEFLNVKTTDLRTTDGDSLAVKIILKKPEGANLPKITLSLMDTPLSEVLRYVAELADLKLRVDGDAFVLEAK